MPSFINLLMKTIDTNRLRYHRLCVSYFSRVCFCCSHRIRIYVIPSMCLCTSVCLLFAILFGWKTLENGKKSIGFAFMALGWLCVNNWLEICLNGFHSFVTWKTKLLQMKWSDTAAVGQMSERKKKCFFEGPFKMVHFIIWNRFSLKKSEALFFVV